MNFTLVNKKIYGWSLAPVISVGPENPGTVLIPTSTKPKGVDLVFYCIEW